MLLCKAWCGKSRPGNTRLAISNWILDTVVSEVKKTPARIGCFVLASYKNTSSKNMCEKSIFAFCKFFLMDTLDGMVGFNGCMIHF